MVVHKLDIDEIEDVDFELIAIHSALEDYRLAYFINQKLNLHLVKSSKEFVTLIKEGEAYFSRFNFEDATKDSCWDLIHNKSEVVVQKKYLDKNLFENTSHEVATNVYFLPEFKQIDFILKIQNSEISPNQIINDISTIDQVVTVYPINVEKIKSKNNLIF